MTIIIKLEQFKIKINTEKTYNKANTSIKQNYEGYT